jgi:uncharacterized membrane-anchored protein
MSDFRATYRTLFVLLALALGLVVQPAFANQGQEDQGPNIDPIPGPITADLDTRASIEVPEGFVFLTAKDVEEFWRYTKQPIHDGVLGAILAPEEMGSYEVYFSFHEEGYIRDDEKNDLDADAIFKTLREGNIRGNEERRRLGSHDLTLLGWQAKPFFNDRTKNLEWATRVRDEEDKHILLNHNTRILGRNGFISAILVCDPDKYGVAVQDFQKTIAALSFNQGERYADFRQGDKVAKYGLTALVTGGAAAVAAKTGLLKYLWKFIVGIGVACATFFGKIFGRKKTA